jgi:hypothetical protein
VTYRQALSRLGFRPVQAYWHWPDFEHCRVIVPLGQPASLSTTLPVARVRLPTRLMAFADWAGLLQRAVPCFSVVGRKV